MFSGIIETLATVTDIVIEGSNKKFTLESPIAHEFKIDQSVAHNGVCLTVVSINNNSYEVVAILETLQKSNLNEVKIGDKINIERCVQMNGRLDGHIVQGHVDTTAVVKSIQAQNGSWVYTFQTETPLDLMVEKGSITINGISLTCFDVKEYEFSVAIIPYTYENTNMKGLHLSSKVNIEFDIVGKYIQRLLRNQ